MTWGVVEALSRLKVLKFVLYEIKEEVQLQPTQGDHAPIWERIVTWSVTQPLLQLFQPKSVFNGVGINSASAGRRFGVLMIAFMLPGCLAERNCFPTACGGPERLIPLNQDLAPIATYDDYAHVLTRYNKEPSFEGKKSIRNDFIFERIYAMDAKYTVYEEGLTRESETEGFAAAVTNAALTGTGALIPVAQTTRLLSGIASGLTTVDQSYSKQFLYNKAVQILQSQMRAKRAEVATNIIARSKFNVIDYPIGMAMTDLEEYYRAGTLASAFIDLSQSTGTNAEIQKAAKDQIKPGAADVARALRAATISNVSAPLPAPVSSRSALGITDAEIGKLRVALCLPEKGNFDADVSARLNKYLRVNSQPDFAGVNPKNRVYIDRLIRMARNSQTADCTLF